MGGKYKGVVAAFEAGDRSMMVDPLDYKILEVLPEEGTQVAGLYQLGETVESLGKRFPVGAPVLSSRVRSMRVLGLVTLVRMVGMRGAYAWQRTQKGKEVYEEWKGQQ